MKTTDFLLVIAATLTALQAGLYYAWSCSVMLGFARLNDREFVAVMRETNRAIQNPVFFLSFFGAPIFLVAAAVFYFGQGSRFWFLLAAAIVYLAGTFAVTIFGNVPLNNRLDQFNSDSATDAEIFQLRASFENRWNNLNHLRAAASTVAVILMTIACLN
jgi:uncharacterized membrane protein